jgi:hypothetical protein
MRTRSAVLAGLAAVGAVSVATALASIPAADGTINGCYAGGMSPAPLSVVDAPADCKDTLLPFAQRGPTGPAGPAGAAGASGSLGSSSRVLTALAPNAERDYAGTATCPAGTILLGGGFELDTLGEGFDVVTSRPNVEVRGWDVVVKRRPGYISQAEVAAALRRAFELINPANQASQEAAAAALRRFRLSLGIGGPGGVKLTKKEQTAIGKAVTKAGTETKEATEAAKEASDVVKGLIEAPAPPATAPRAYALCGAA